MKLLPPPQKKSAVPKCSRSKRGRTQMSGKERKRVQKSAKERFRVKNANNQVWNNQVWPAPASHRNLAWQRVLNIWNPSQNGWPHTWPHPCNDPRSHDPTHVMTLNTHDPTHCTTHHTWPHPSHDPLWDPSKTPWTEKSEIIVCGSFQAGQNSGASRNPQPPVFSQKYCRYKCEAYEAYCGTNRRRTAVPMEVYCGVSLSPNLSSQQGTALQMGGVLWYKLEVYCQYFVDKLYGLGAPKLGPV